MTLPQKQYKQCENHDCGLFKKKLSTREEKCGNCGSQLNPYTGWVRRVIGSTWQLTGWARRITMAGGAFVVVMVMVSAVVYYIGHRSKGGEEKPPVQPQPIDSTQTKKILEFGPPNKKIETETIPKQPPSPDPTLEIRKKLAEIKTQVEHLNLDASNKTQEIVKIRERLDAIESVPGKVATDVEKQLKAVKQDIINAVNTKIQEGVEQLQAHINEDNLAKFKSMFAELNVKLDKRDQNIAEVKQAIDRLQSKFDSQFFAILAKIRQLMEISPANEEIDTLKQAVIITQTIQLKQIADTFVLKAENNLVKQMLEEFARKLAILPFSVVEKQYPRLGFEINYFYYQSKNQGIPKDLTDNTVLLKGDEFYVVFTPDQESYVYIFQKDVLGKCYLLYHSSSPVQPKQRYEVPNTLKERFVVKDERPGVETILFQATRQQHSELGKISSKELEFPINPEYCHPPATLPILKVGNVSGRGQLLCEDCATVLTFIYKHRINNLNGGT